MISFEPHFGQHLSFIAEIPQDANEEFRPPCPGKAMAEACFASLEGEGRRTASALQRLLTRHLSSAAVAP
jgi:hypothetical protein